MSEFFQFSRDIFNFRFFAALAAVGGLAVFLPRKWTKPFRSVRVNVFLFLVIAGASAAGTFLPDGGAPVYHSWWFAGLLALMAFNVLVCKLDRLPRVLLGPPVNEQGPVRGSVSGLLSQAKLRRTMATRKSSVETEGLLIQWAEANKFEYEIYPARIGEPESAPPNGKILFASKHGVQRWGDFLLHVSIVGILAGGLLGAMVGFEESLPIQEKETVPLVNRDWTVRLDDFDIARYETTGAPSLYASAIEVKQGETLLGRKRIIVNDPLDIDGVRFYQASWGMTNSFHTARIFIGGRILTVRQGEIADVPDSPFSIRVNELLPTFSVDDQGRVINRDSQGANIALQIDFFNQGRPAGRVWVLKDRPEEAYLITGNTVEPTAPPPFRVAGVDPLLFSGIQVGYDPGAPLFWLGSLALLAGLCLHFYFHQRRLRVLFFEDEGGLRLEAGAWTSRPVQDFQRQFDGLMGDLSKLLR